MGAQWNLHGRTTEFAWIPDQCIFYRLNKGWGEGHSFLVLFLVSALFDRLSGLQYAGFVIQLRRYNHAKGFSLTH